MEWIGYVILGVILLSYAAGGISAAPWVPTKPRQTRRMVEAAGISDGDKVYDLGCGSGTLLFAAADGAKDVTCVGFEISALPFCLAKVRSWFSRLDVRVRYANLFKADLSDADVVFVFLLEKSYEKLMPTLKGLKDDARVVVEVWPLPGVEAVEVIKEDGLLPIYVYRGDQF